jgi:hypothetical protein
VRPVRRDEHARCGTFPVVDGLGSRNRARFAKSGRSDRARQYISVVSVAGRITRGQAVSVGVAWMGTGIASSVVVPCTSTSNPAWVDFLSISTLLLSLLGLILRRRWVALFLAIQVSGQALNPWFQHSTWLLQTASCAIALVPVFVWRSFPSAPSQGSVKVAPSTAVTEVGASGPRSIRLWPHSVVVSQPRLPVSHEASAGAETSR